jgi:hypothetical protein
MTIVNASSAAARDALTPKHEGLTVYRTDKDWNEIWDGGAWRVRSFVTVAALADITNPYTDQVVLLASDDKMYRWNGSAWTELVSTSTSGAMVGYASYVGASTITSSDGINEPRATVANVINGRVYEIVLVRTEANSSGTPILSVRGRVAAGSTVDHTGTQFGDTATNGGTGSYTTYFRTMLWTATFTGQATFGFSSSTNSGAISVDPARARYIWVKDVSL